MRKPQTKLERHVAKWLRAQAKDCGDTIQGVYHDLMEGGCRSGMVSHLIYYDHTIKFYRSYRVEINQLLTSAMCDFGSCSPVDIFGDKWDTDDPLACATTNQNLLAWFGFEETARLLCEVDV